MKITTPRTRNANAYPIRRQRNKFIYSSLHIVVTCVGLLFINVLPLFAQSIKYTTLKSGSHQRLLIEHFAKNEGLSDVQVTTIAQDQQGYLWFGTRDGLNKFDGYQFTVYKNLPGDPHSISNNEINVLYVDRSGRLWIGTNGGLNYYDPKTEKFSAYQFEANSPNSLSDNYIRALYEDQEGLFWVGGQRGLNLFNPTTNTFKLYHHKVPNGQDPRDGHPQEISALAESKAGHLIIGYWGMGIMRFNKKEERFTKIFLDEKLDERHWVNLIAADNQKELWISSSGKVFKYEPKKEKQTALPLPNSPDGAAPFCLIPTTSGHLLSGSHSEGLYILDAQYQVIRQFKPTASESEIPSYDNWIEIVFEDRAGDYWIGTKGTGVFHLNQKGNQFTNLIQRPEGGNKLADFYTTDLIEVEKDQLWLSTRKHGISLFDQSTRHFSPLPETLEYPHGLNHKEVTCLFQDSQKNIWIGTWGKGVNIYQSKTRNFSYFMNDYNDPHSLADAFVTGFLETQEGEIWIGTTFGLSVFTDQVSIQKKKAKRYYFLPEDSTGLNHPWITAMEQTRWGAIWIGTKDGLHQFDRKQDNFIRFLHDNNNRQSLISNNITYLFEDSKENLWVGTGSGLAKWDEQTRSFEWFTKERGLVDDHILQIAEDQSHYLWISTTKGLSRLDPKSKKFKNYDAKDGLFNFDPFIISKHSGLLYAGGENGLSYFHPDSIRDNSFIPPIVISSLKKYNTRSEQISATEIKGIAAKKSIHLSYLDQVITLGLTALNYRNTERNQYAYQLEGFNESWINNGAKREISFTNLDPGEYTLRVIGSNNHDVWNKEGTFLKINIAPPWWQTYGAYFLYSILIIGLLFLTYRILLRRQELKNQLQFEKSEAIRLKELDVFKTRLTTNLTHEFRTPLTVILGMVGLMKNEPKKYLNQGTQLIESNGKNLLRLINQLLDLSKLEDHSFQLKLQQGDIVPYLRYITEAFQTYANGKNLSLRFFTTLESLIIKYDEEQIKQVMTNLIANAIKFTGSGGEVSIRLSANTGREQIGAMSKTKQLIIEVKDTGIGISENDLPHIFDRFYQVDGSSTRKEEGSGIGLAHTQELVKLMGGTIHAKSAIGKGTSFIVSLPIHKETAIADSPKPYF